MRNRYGGVKRMVLVMCCICALLMAGCSASNAAPDPVSEPASDQASEHVSEPAQAQTQDTLQVDVLKIGKADAIIAQCAGETMVIDCGEEEDGQEVLDFLEDSGIEKIDVLMITHYDKDHVGGADVVIKGIEVGRVLVSAYTGTSDQYAEFMDVLQKAGITPENVEETLNFELGPASVTVEPPASYEIPDDGDEYDNDFSLITTIENGTKRLVFAGDIEKKRIREWLEGGTAQKCDVLKVPHHGVYNSALEDLFQTLQPSYAVICDSKKNPADERTLELLAQCGAKCLETKDGDITIICEGDQIEVHQ